jgi:hypothetical protein
MLAFDLDEVITSAIMSSTPAIIVEGKDDVKFYQMLASEIDKEIEVYAVENFEDFGQGCNSVIDAITYLQYKINEKPENVNYVLGIIDRDARFFRNEIPTGLKGLFILKYYSYESHFITRNNLIKLISFLTNIGVSNIPHNIISYIEEPVKSNLNELYYVSLEALKNACELQYKGEIGYSAKPGKVSNETSRRRLLRGILKKKDELDTFAKELNITPDDLLFISKGKWVLHTFCESALKKIKELEQACSNGIIDKCQFCKTGNFKKCLWRVNFNCQIDAATQILLNWIDIDEVRYIIDKLGQLGNFSSEEEEVQSIESNRRIS